MSLLHANKTAIVYGGGAMTGALAKLTGGSFVNS